MRNHVTNKPKRRKTIACPLLCVLAAVCMLGCGGRREASPQVRKTAVQVAPKVSRDTQQVVKKKPLMAMTDTLPLSDYNNNRHEIYGQWCTPHAAPLQIRFFRDNSFAFYLYDDEDSVSYGTFDLKGEKLTLHFLDGTSLRLTFNDPWGGDPQADYYITKGRKRNWEYYFVKSDNPG